VVDIAGGTKQSRNDSAIHAVGSTPRVLQFDDAPVAKRAAAVPGPIRSPARNGKAATSVEPAAAADPAARGNTGANGIVVSAGDLELTQELARVGVHFDVEYYRTEYPDIALAETQLLRHFCTIGWREGRNPNAFFDTVSYLLSNADVARSRINPYYHYLRHGIAEGRAAASAISPSIRSNLLFGVSICNWVERLRPHIDMEYYLEQIDDPDLRKVDPVAHFAYRGWREGKAPSRSFDVSEWLKTNPTAAAFAVNPLLIKIEADSGQFDPRSLAERNDFDAAAAAPAASENTHAPEEGPSIGESAIAPADDSGLPIVALEFSADYYRAAFPDVAKAGVDPLLHFFHTGWREGRNPNLHFDTKYYIEANTDVRDAGINPFLHFLTAGKAEGRLPRRPGGYRRQIIDAAMEPAKRPPAGVEPGEKVLRPTALLQKLTAAVSKRRGLVVSLSHDCYIRVIGGTQIFIADEQARFNELGHAYLHISPQIARLWLVDHDPRFLVRIVLDGVFLGLSTIATVANTLERIRSRKRGRSILAVHSVLGFHADDIIRLASAVRAERRLYWLHDYSSICAGFNLLRNDAEFCGAPPVGSPACRVCVYGRTRHRHLADLQRLFAACKFDVVSPSPIALKLWLGASDLPRNREYSHPHWQLVAKKPGRKKWKNDAAVDALNIAFVGFPSANKGWPLFCQLVQRLGQDSRYRFWHFAARDTSSLPGVTFVQTEVTSQDRQATSRLLAEHAIDVVLVLSPWPETFSFVAHEAIASGAQIVCLADSGNVAELVRTSKNGRVVKDDAELFALFASDDAPAFAAARTKGASYSIKQVGTGASIKGIVATTGKSGS